MLFENKFKLGISLYRIFSRAYFYLPFLVVYFYKNNLTITEISFIMAIYGLSALIISTFLKTRLESKLKTNQMLILSEVFKFIGLGILAFSTDFLSYCLGQVFLGIGYSVGVGEDSQIIKNDINDMNGDFQAKSNSYMFNTLLITGLIGSWLFKLNIVYPIYATMIGALCSIISISFFLGDVSSKNETRVEKESSNSKVDFTNYEKKYILAYSFFRGIILTLFTGILPYHLFVDLDVPVYQFILILTSYTLIGSFSSKMSNKLINFGNELCILSLLLLSSLVLFYLNNIVYTIIGTVLLGVSSGPIRPITVKKMISSKNDTSLLFSRMEIYYSLINIVLLLSGGILYQYYDFQKALLIFIVTLFIYFVLILKKGKRKKEND